jgi:hypothetical protein
MAALMIALRASASPMPASLSFGQTTADNWAGYAVTPVAAVSSVGGNFVVPTLTSSGGLQRGNVAFWVGMDGNSNNVVEQIGIVSLATNNSYSAWFEMYPAPSQTISMLVFAGDTIHAQVDYLGSNQYQLSIANLTSGVSFSTVQASAEEEPRSSGEWIAEIVGARLANFGSLTFTNASATLDDGSSGAISSFPYDSIDMVPANGPGAVAGPLDATGRSFTITVPEPAGLALLGIVGVGLMRRRRGRADGSRTRRVFTPG